MPNPHRRPPPQTPLLYAHPFSSYCQKVLIALYENDTPFEWRLLSQENPAAMSELMVRWPLARFPMLMDGDRAIVEASIIIEHLGLYHGGPVTLIPDDARAALEVRSMDRFFDNYISTPQQKIVFDCMRAEDDRDPCGVIEARKMLETSYAWLDKIMSGREWAAGDAFSLADCAAAPFLFYADWCHSIDPVFANVRAYRQRLLARPSFARVVDEARPYRGLFPLGAPDRD
ncbi:MAG: glutathione S-transferase family protein [Dokdonella sp.]